MPGATFASALADRYGAEDTTDYGADAFSLGAGARPRRGALEKKWEMVGMEKTRVAQAAHANLRIVGLKDAGIDAPEAEAGEIAALGLKRCVELDLSGNPIAGGAAGIATITAALPALRELRLNRVSTLLASGLAPARWPVLHILSLNQTGVQWETAVTALGAPGAAPALRELHLEGNGITALPVGPAVLSKLQVLQLSANPEISGWADILPALGVQCPGLVQLGLNGTAVPAPVEDDAVLGRLTSIGLLETKALVGVASLDHLRRRCPGLASLRASYDVMFPGMSEVQARMMVVASIPTLEALNHGAVRPKERADAELFYIQRARAVAASDDAELTGEAVPEIPKADRSAVADRDAKFPFYRTLREKHRATVMSSVGDAAGATTGIGALTLNLTFRLLGKPDVKKAVPGGLAVAKVKAMISAMFPKDKADAARQRLSFFPGDAGVVVPAVPLDDDFQSLAYCGVGDGAIIIVDLKE